MKKFFLIPLLTLVCSVMAWGSEIVVNNFADLKTQLSASGTADVVKLKNDIAYEGTTVLNIERSLTLDGQGHKIIGYGKLNTKVNVATSANNNTVIAVNYQGNVESTLEVAIQNLYIGSTDKARHYGVIAFDGVKSLLLQNDSIVYTQKDYIQPICVNGYQSTKLELTIEDSYINAGPGGYPAYILKPINATLTNSIFAGYCGLYFKGPETNNGNYGAPCGARSSVITADACTFDCPNTNKGESNNFAIFPLEDDGITLNLNNCSMNAENLGNDNNGQRLVNLQYNKRENGANGQDVYVNISGDNTHIYNIEGANPDKLIWNGWVVGQQAPSSSEGRGKQTFSDIKVTISGGTLNINPEDVRWFVIADNKPKATTNGQYTDQSSGTGAITIPSTHEVKTVNQGGVTVYRVVKKAARDGEEKLYDLNDNVQSQGDGQNPTTSFELSDGSAMTLNQATTKAGYVEVKDNATAGATTVTVGTPTEDQTLVINNGLDVQGNSKVDVQAGSTLVIGKGGIVTEDPKNIVIEADRAGAASLIMDPAITVNQTPNLTVRMTAKQIGKTLDGEFWHRFAMPVQHADSWDKEGSLGTGNDKYPTFLYGWNYSTDSWYKLPNGVSDMQAFMGYTLRLATEETATDQLQDVVYIFKGQLAGNTNNTLQFSRNGYNFFGNSYTGYIDLKQLVAQITSDSKIEGTAWVWNTDMQRYQDVPLNLLAAGTYDGESDKWKTEIAPMQTFILKQNGSNNASTEINYASAVWGNPRYSAATGVVAAPARRVANMNTTRMYIAVTAANGQSDEVFFVEDANYSDAFDNGYDASKYMNPNTINVFANQNGIDLGTVASDNLNGKTLSLNTNGELAYTMSFKNVEGEEYAIRDNVTGAVINIEEGATYEFAAQPNSTIEGRFEIVAIAKLPTAIENTEVKANVKGIYTIMGQYLGENFDILPAGVYVVNGVKIVK